MALIDRIKEIEFIPITIVPLIILVGVGGWLLVRFVHKPQVSSTSTTVSSYTSEQIRDIFHKSPEGSSNSNAVAIAPSQPNSSSPSQPTTNSAPTNQAPAPSTPSPTTNRGTGQVAGSATAVGPYKNSDIGIELPLPTGWSVNQNGDRLIFADAKGITKSWIETHSNPPSSPDLLAAQLKQSPGVFAVGSGSVGNQKALKFSLTSSPFQGLAVIVNNKLYYIFGELVNSPVLSSLKFI